MTRHCLLCFVAATLLGCGGAPPVEKSPAAAASTPDTKAAAVTPAPRKSAPTKAEQKSGPKPEPQPEPTTPEPTPDGEPPALDIEYVPTPDNVVAKMLQVAAVTKDDIVYDLGCGDGRLVIEAAKRYGAHGKGFDLDPERVAEAKANVEKAKVGHLVTIEQKNIFDVDLTPASVVTLYLLPTINVRLIPQLEKLAPGSRIISHDFDMKGVTYDDVWTIVAKNHRPKPKKRDHYVYRWTTPLKHVDTDE